MLRERLASAEGRAERAEAATRDFAEAKERIRTLEGEIRTWEETARQLPGVDNRGDLATRFEELQKEALTARAKVGARPSRSRVHLSDGFLGWLTKEEVYESALWMSVAPERLRSWV